MPPPEPNADSVDSGLELPDEPSFGSSAEGDTASDASGYWTLERLHQRAFLHRMALEEEDEEEEDEEDEEEDDEGESVEYSDSLGGFWSASELPPGPEDEDFPAETVLSGRRRSREARWASCKEQFEDEAMRDEEEELRDEALREYCREDWDREHRASAGSDTSSVLRAERSLLPDSSGSTDVRSRSPKAPRGCRPTLVAAVRKMEARRRAAAAAAKCSSSSSEETPPPRHTPRVFQDCSTDRSGSSSASSEDRVMLELPWDEAVSAWRGRSAVVHHRVRMPTPEPPPDDSGIDQTAVAPLTDAEVEELMQLRARVVVDIMVHHFGNDPGKLLAEAEQECGTRGPLVQGGAHP